MKYLTINKISILFILILSFLLFSPGFFSYFYQDDFIHLSYSQTINQVITAFNLFYKADYPFYRPLSTQLYFYIGKLFFGFNPLGYHVVNFVIFAINIFLVNKVLAYLSKNKRASLISTLFFAINSTHVAPLFSAANVQELLYVFFGILVIYNYLLWLNKSKPLNKYFSYFLFIFALMSKETAIILPVILFLLTIFFEKVSIKKTIKELIPYSLILLIYLLGHYVYGYPSSASYKIAFGIKNLNILLWYLLWSLSTPNILIDFIGPGIKFNHVFLEVARANGYIFFIFFLLFLVTFVFISISVFSYLIEKNRLYQLKLIGIGLFWFVIGLLPLIVFPLHRLATEQSFSLIGLSLVIGIVLNRGLKNSFYIKLTTFFCIISYLVVAVNSVQLARRTHWVINSADKARNVVQFFKNNYSNFPKDTVIYFKNGEVKIPEYGSSKQIYLALGNGEGLKLIFNRRDLKIYYEDLQPLPESIEKSNNILVLDASNFLGY